VHQGLTPGKPHLKPLTRNPKNLNITDGDVQMHPTSDQQRAEEPTVKQYLLARLGLNQPNNNNLIICELEK
jgi:hypothetical protein